VATTIRLTCDVPPAWLPNDRIYRRSFGNHAGGTSQVKRMVVATRVLGLPR